MLYKVVDSIVGIRADEAEEITGLDLVEHGERGYNTGVFSGTAVQLGMWNEELGINPAAIHNHS